MLDFDYSNSFRYSIPNKLKSILQLVLNAAVKDTYILINCMNMHELKLVCNLMICKYWHFSILSSSYDFTMLQKIIIVSWKIQGDVNFWEIN